MKEEIEHLKKILIRDELTGILNRKGIKEEVGGVFDEILYEIKNKDLKRKIRIGDLSVLFMDIDDFKKINDICGHEAGDEVLRRLAAVLKKKIRGIDAAGRLGGEEFIVALVGASEDDAFDKAEEIREYAAKNIKIPGRKKSAVTLSIGVASLGNSGAETLMDLIAMADKAMYEAKNNRGKNNTVKYSEIK